MTSIVLNDEEERAQGDCDTRATLFTCMETARDRDQPKTLLAKEQNSYKGVKDIRFEFVNFVSHPCVSSDLELETKLAPFDFEGTVASAVVNSTRAAKNETESHNQKTILFPTTHIIPERMAFCQCSEKNGRQSQPTVATTPRRTSIPTWTLFGRLQNPDSSEELLSA